MRLILPTVVLTFFASLGLGAEIFYPKTPLQRDPLENGQSLYPGTLEAPLASGNAVRVDYIPGEKTADPDSAFGGFARTGTSEKNTLTIQNGHVVRFAFGGCSLKGDVNANEVVFSDGITADAAIGKLCGGQTQDGDLNDNSVTITGGRIVGDVYGGDADADGSATGNRVEIRGGTLSGFVNGGGVSGVGIARKNSVRISGGTIGMGVAGGFAHFASGSSSQSVKSENETPGEKTSSVLENAVSVSGNAEIGGNVSGGFILDSDGSANRNSLEISGGTIRGTVYGGRAYGGAADGNAIVISGGTIKSRENAVYAGFVYKPESGRAEGNTITLSGSPDLTTITLYGNNLSSWKTDGNTLNVKGFRGTVAGLSRFQEINIDKKSCITVIGEGPHEIFNLNNEGRLIFQNGKPTIFGKTSGNPVE